MHIWTLQVEVPIPSTTVSEFYTANPLAELFGKFPNSARSPKT